MTENLENNPVSPNELTLQFHETYGQPVRTQPVYAIAELIMRAELVREEAEELEDGLNKNSIIDVADALGDLVYVCYGAAHTHGLNLDSAFGITDGETPAKPLLSSFLQEGYNPAARPSLNQEDARKVISSLRNVAEDYNTYVNEVGLEDGSIDIVRNFLVFLVSGSYYASFVFGIPLDAVLQEIQKSNMSKLGEDGKPIYREDGKVLKGPNFFTPEQNIAAVLVNAGAELTSEQDLAFLREDETDTGAIEIVEEKTESRDLLSSEAVSESIEPFTAEELSNNTGAVEIIDESAEETELEDSAVDDTEESFTEQTEPEIEEPAEEEGELLTEDETVTEAIEIVETVEESSDDTEVAAQLEDEAYVEEVNNLESLEDDFLEDTVEMEPETEEEAVEEVSEEAASPAEETVDEVDESETFIQENIEEEASTNAAAARSFDDAEPDFDSLFRKK